MANDPQSVAEWGKSNPRTVTPGSDKKAEEETMDQFWKKRKDSLEAKVKIRELEREEARYEGNQGGFPAGVQTPVNKEDMSFAKLLVDMYKDERVTRQKAEDEKDIAKKQVLENQADVMKTQIEEFRAERAQTSDPIELFRRWKQVENEMKAEVAKDIPKNPNPGVDSATAIMLQERREQHEERMTEIRQGNAVTLEQMRQQHDIAMQEAADRRVELEIKMREIEIGGTKKQDTWASIMGVVGGAVGAALTGQGNPADAMGMPVGTQQRTTPAGVGAYRCQKCQYPIPVPPEMLQSSGVITCPQCGMQYQVGQPPHIHDPKVEEPIPVPDNEAIV